jgi:hypothetical protein
VEISRKHDACDYVYIYIYIYTHTYIHAQEMWKSRASMMPVLFVTGTSPTMMQYATSSAIGTHIYIYTHTHAYVCMYVSLLLVDPQL